MDSGLLTSRKTLVQARHLAERVSPSPGRSPRPSDGRGVRGEGDRERGEGRPVLRSPSSAVALLSILRSSTATEDGRRMEVRVVVSGHFDSMSGPILRAESAVLSLWLFIIQARFGPGI